MLRRACLAAFKGYTYVAIEEGKQDDVDDREVERDEHDDRLARGQEKGAVEGALEMVVGLASV